MTANSNLIISISAKDQASGTFRKIRVSLGELEKSSESVGESAGDLGQILQSGLGKLGATLGGAFAAQQLAQGAFELGKLGAAAQRTRASYESMAASIGQSGQAMLQAMREATAGTVSDSELMLSANRAMMLGVADSAEEMARLMAAAISRGRALGVSASQAVSDIITGIGRMSPQILDNLGIVGAQQSMEKYAATLGKTVKQLSDVEKKQALVNAVLASAPSPSVVDDAAAAFERMDASIANAKEALGVLFSPAIAAIADKIAEGATIALNAAKAPATELEKTFASLEERARIWQDVFARSLGSGTGDITAQTQAQAFQTLSFAIEQTNQAIAAGVPGAQQWGDTLNFVATEALRTGQLSQSNLAVLSSLVAILAQASAATGGFALAENAAAPAIDAVTQKLLAQAEAARQAIAATAQQQGAGVRSALLSMAGDLGAGAALDAYREINAELQRRTELMQQWGYTAERIEFENAAWVQEQIARLRQLAAEYAAMGAAPVEAAHKAGAAFRRITAGIDTIVAHASAAQAALSRMANIANRVAIGRSQLDDLGRIGRPISAEDVEIVSKFDAALGHALDTAYSGGAGGGGIGGVADEFSSLQSQIESVIQSATSGDIGGLNPADFLPREDAINENARRLAAIMRDGLGNQEWMDEFRQEVPGIFEELAASGDARTAAARILQEFQAGLRPELLDREQIKERVRQMILGDQATAQLAQELAQELSQELGVSLQQAQSAVAGAMNLGAPGGELPSGAQAAPDGANAATVFAAAWEKKIGATLEIFENSGKAAGNAFGVGFLAVQGTMLDSWASQLVTRMIPAVIAALAAQNSRTGAQ